MTQPVTPRSSPEMFFWLIQILLALLILGAVFLRNLWPFDIIAGALGQLTLLSVVTALILFCLGRYGGFSLLMLSAIVALWRMAPGYENARPELSNSDFKIVWANLFGRNQSLKSVLNLALKEDASIVALAEFPAHSKIPSDFRERFPHRFPKTRNNNNDTVIFSRSPLLESQAIASDRRPVLIVKTEIDGDSITIGAVHSPVPWTPQKSVRQSKIISAAFAALDKDSRSLLIGDFNATPWNKALADPQKKAKRLQRVAIGKRSTWISNAPLIGAPIDHAFASHNLEASAKLGPANGSDHFPLIISVRQQSAN